ncbi:MAG: UDP-N-acetylmuramoyl-L-alanyl-D-glutamate--2,6-diaminopimelate ligase [candidate division NC10 bacterium]|nr:UDP-N-acetylmuramoyl-L-alanyl-D-glutamate--2,6-diaminopimelate ligase [candidate division NC10 bacterium]
MGPGKRLGELLVALEGASRVPDLDLLIRGIAYDSRRVRPGYLFVCIQGFREDGHRYAQDAVARGAVCLVAEKRVEVPPTVPVIRVGNARRALALLANEFYDRPSTQLTLIGVTGTQGKTTTVYLIESILREAGYPVGLIGTIVTRVGAREWKSTYTTPESLDLQESLRACLSAGLTHVVMEVSSHGLALERVAGCVFDVGVFTNLSSDHLDLHRTLERYLAAKATLFASLGTGKDRCAIINVDDRHSSLIQRAAACRRLTYGIQNPGDIMAREVRAGLRRLEFTLEAFRETHRVRMSLTGEVNVYNALAAAGACFGLGLDRATIVRGLERVEGVPGRFELVEAGQGYLVIIDFAHTERAVEQLLQTVRGLVRGRVITVFGCAGDRDQTKRPRIGELVARLSDYSIITADNPASEDPREIALQVDRGAREIDSAGQRHAIVLDRAEAITRAIATAKPGDAVIIAGKGHEEYQIMKDGFVPWSDRGEVLRAIAARGTSGRP